MARRLAALLVAFCLAGATAVAEEEASVFRVGVEGSVRTIDPHRAASPSELQIAEACFEGLTFMHPETLQPVPGLASQWTRSKDRRTWTFTLRAEARWSDDRPVTAPQVAASMRRALDPAMRSAWAPMLFSIDGARALCEGGEAADAITRPLHDHGLVYLLRDFIAAHPEGVDKATWTGWPSRTKLPAVLARASEPLVREALASTRDRWSAADLETLAKSLTQAAARLQKEHDVARATFGRTRGVVAVDARTLRIDLVRPNPWLLHTLALPICAPVPPEIVKQIVSRWNPRTGRREAPWWSKGTPVVNGPYRVERLAAATRKAGSVVRLVRNPTYWNAAAIRQPVFELIGLVGGHEGLQRFVAGELDWSQAWPPALMAALSKADTFRLRESNVAYFYEFQCAHAAVRDARVRRALAQAVDRKALVATALPGLGRPAATLVPAALPGYTPPAQGLAFDPVAAQALLAAAGHPGGRGVPEIVILYNKADTHKAVAAFVAAQWRKHLGLTVVLRAERWPAYIEARDAGAFVVARAGWISDDPDPLSFLALFESGDPDNHSRWSDPAYDAALEAARLQPLGPARQARLVAAEAAMLRTGAPCVPLFWYRAGDLVQTHVRGFRTRAKGASPAEPGAHNVSGLHPFRGLWIDAKPR